MTFAPRLCAVLMIAAPDPGSRSTSRMTLAPLVSAWSPWLRWVLGSPWALTMVCGMPAALNAWSRYRRSCVSHRTDDCVSGSSTAILPLFELPPLVLVELLLLDPQPTPMAAAAMTRAPSAHFDLTEPILLVVDPSLSESSSPDDLPGPPRQRAGGVAGHEHQSAEQLGAAAQLAGHELDVAGRARH